MYKMSVLHESITTNFSAIGYRVVANSVATQIVCEVSIQVNF